MNAFLIILVRNEIEIEINNGVEELVRSSNDILSHTVYRKGTHAYKFLNLHTPSLHYSDRVKPTTVEQVPTTVHISYYVCMLHHTYLIPYMFEANFCQDIFQGAERDKYFFTTCYLQDPLQAEL